MRMLIVWCLVALAAPALPAHAQKVTYVHTDALGSAVLETDASRQIIGTRSEYEPYGRMIAGSINDEPGYTGHVMDAATGLTYMQQRYYDPMLGRFLSIDPVIADANTGGNFNRYRYGNNNPYYFVDPDGRKGVAWLVRLTANSIVKKARVTREQAVRAARRGQDVMADSRKGAKRITNQASEGKGVIEDSGHKLKDGSIGSPHFHFSDRSGGHIFYSAVAVAASVIADSAEGVAQAAELAEHVDPISVMTNISDVGAGSDCASGCESIFRGGGAERGGGFQGTFQVEGRIDSKRLDKKLQRKD